MSSVIVDDFKLIKREDTEEYELFDLKDDFYEEYNLVKNPEHKRRIRDLKRTLKNIEKKDRLKLDMTDKVGDITEEEMKKLKSLGYVDSP